MSTHQTRGIPLRPDPSALRSDAMRALSRAAVAFALGRENAEDVLVDRGFGDDRLALLVLRGPVSPTDRTSAAALAQVARGFVESLGVMSAGAALLSRAISISLAGRNEVIVPRVAPGVAAFVGEGSPGPVMQLSTEGPHLKGGYKLLAVLAATNELLRQPDVEDILQTALVETAAQGLDVVLLDDQPASLDRPAGLRYGVAAATASAAATALDALTDDVCTLASAVAKIAVNPDNIVLITSAKKAVACSVRPPKALPYAVLGSAQLSDDMVLAVAANAIVTSLDAPRFDAPVHASLVMADPASAIVDGSGVVATVTRSGFQHDSSGVKLVQKVTWVPRTATGAVAWLSTTKW